jgi:signal transduction histidine kinase
MTSICLWVVAKPLTIEEATDALEGAVPDLDQHLGNFNLELASARDWFLQDSIFEGEKARRNWHGRLGRAGARGYRGVRATGDTTWLGNKDWKHWCDFEDGMNDVFRALVASWPTESQRLAMLCTYPLAACGAPQILDVVRTHQFVLARRYGNWDVVETAGLKQAKAEIQRLNDQLEQRVIERTDQLMRASEALLEAQAQLAHVNRVATMGELTASIAHEVLQPLAAVNTNADAGLRWLAGGPPNLDRARACLERIARDGKQAGEVITRVRALVKKSPPTKAWLDLRETIQEALVVINIEAERHQVSVGTELAAGLPSVQADRVQLQQVVLNLVMNGIDAMKAVTDRPRELLIKSQPHESGEVLVAVQDSGIGVDQQKMGRLFESFYTTKPEGMGLGLRISRSIIEAHGGRLWATPNAGPGVTVQFTLPIGDRPPASGMDLS